MNFKAVPIELNVMAIALTYNYVPQTCMVWWDGKCGIPWVWKMSTVDAEFGKCWSEENIACFFWWQKESVLVNFLLHILRILP